MALDVQIFPVAGKVAAIVFFLPAAVSFVAALSHGNALSVLAVRRTVAPHGRDYFLLVNDPTGRVVDGNGLLIVVHDKASGVDSHLDASSGIRWQWSAPIKTGLGAWLESHEKRGGVADLLGLRRFLSTVAAQTAVPVAVMDTAAGFIVAIEGRYSGSEILANAILETPACLLYRRCGIAVSRSENLTLVLVPEPCQRAYVDLDGALVEIDCAGCGAELPLSAGLAQEVLELIATQPAAPGLPDLHLPRSLDAPYLTVQAITSDRDGLIVFLEGRDATDLAGWSLMVLGDDERRLDDGRLYNMSATRADRFRFVVFLDGDLGAGPVRVSAPGGVARWLRILGHRDPLLHRVVRDLGDTAGMATAPRMRLDRLRNACGAVGTAVLRREYGLPAGNHDGDAFAIWDDLGHFDSVEFSVKSLPLISNNIAIICAGASAEYRLRIGELAVERSLSVTLIELPMITDGVLVLKNLLLGQSGRATVIRAGACLPAGIPDPAGSPNSPWRVQPGTSRIDGVSFDARGLVTMADEGCAPAFGFDALMERLASVMDDLMIVDDGSPLNNGVLAAAMASAMVDIAEVVRLDRVVAHAG